MKEINNHSPSSLFSFFLCMLLTVVCLGVQAQDRIVIHGTVKGRNETPLQGATVRVLGGKTARTTDSLGVFSMAVTSGVTLEISYVGYASTSLTVGRAGEDGI